MLKEIISSITFIIFSTVVFGQETDSISVDKSVIDYISFPGPIKFKSEEFFLTWSKKNTATWYQQQYIQRDDDVDNYQDRINVSFFDKDIDPFEAAKMKKESIEERKEKTKDNYSFVGIVESPDGTEVIVDYLVTVVTQDKEPYAEYNIDRFKTIKVNDKPCLLIYSYSKRYIEGDFKYMSRVVNKERNRLIEAVINSKMPTIKLTSVPGDKGNNKF